MVERGCGVRKPSGVYLVSTPSRYGRPIEDFLVDPPQALRDAEGLLVDLPKIGQVLQEAVYEERDGERVMVRPSLVLDWVGAEYYPNVADFVEEVRRYGMSRRVSARFDFSQLVPGSRQVLVHPRATILNADEYQRERCTTVGVPTCPKLNGETERAQQTAREHTAAGFTGMCAGLWYEDLDEATVTRLVREPVNGDLRTLRACQREMPAFTYGGAVRPEGVTPRYQPGIFLSLPITGIELVDDPGWEESSEIADRFDALVRRASASRLPVDVVSE